MLNKLTASIPPHLRKNILFLYGDIGVWGFYVGSTIVFLPVYAARAGATPYEIGLLNALPALVALFSSAPMGMLVRSISPRKIVLLAGFFGRGGLLVYALIPWLAPADYQVEALLWAAVLLALPNTLVAICFGPFFLASCPSDWRGSVVAARIAIMSVLQFATTLLCGQILSGTFFHIHIPFPLNYQLVFFIGFAGAFATLYMIYHVTEIEAPPPAPAAPAMAGPAGRLRALLPVLDGAGKHYLWVALLMFSLNFTGFMTVPLVPDFLVHTLKLGDGIISVGSAVSSLIVFLISLFVARLARRTGNRRASVGGIILISAQFVILSQAHAPGLYLLSMVLGGIANGILASALYNYQLDVLPPADRTVWSSWNSMLGNGAALLGSIAGPAFAALTGTPQALLFLALARLVIGVVIWIWG